MREAPERIFARVDYDGTFNGQWVDADIPTPPPFIGNEPKYIRADIHATEVKRLRAENAILRAERSGAVWVCPECDIAGCKHYRAALQGETK